MSITREVFKLFMHIYKAELSKRLKVMGFINNFKTTENPETR